MRCVVVPESASAAVKNGYAQVLAVHAALLHTGKILYFSGDQHDPGRLHVNQFDAARLFNCQTLAITSPAAFPAIRDLFCCGHAFLSDGRLLVAGGTEAWTIGKVGGVDPHHHAAAGHFRGLAEAYAFDPASEQWVSVQRMAPQPGKATGGGRWYPTLVTQGSGHVAAFSGHPSDADTRHYNNTVEEFRAAPAPLGQWVDLGTNPPVLPGYPDLTYYPRLHLLKNGRLFVSSPINGQSLTWDTATHVWTAICAGPGNEYDGIETNSVLLPLLPEDSYRTRVLVCGRETAKRVDLEAVTPSWGPTLARTLLVGGVPPRRVHCNAIILPTGDVVVCGGMRNPGDDPGSAVREIEVYRPSTNSWVTLPASTNAQVPRNYHSAALLMPDGRVWMAGSNRRGSWSFHNPADYSDTAGNLTSLPTTAQDDAINNRELRIELFEPWYFGRPDRPAFTKSTTVVSVGGTFEISTTRWNTISRVAVVRAGSATHSFNPDQRYVGLPFTRTAGKLTVSVPDNEHLLPPGYYLLFVLDSVVDPISGATLDVPSLGQFFRIVNGKPFKELKFELKDTIKWELKENLKQELDIYVKHYPDIPDPKLIREGDPFDKWRFLKDPPYILRLLAERVDNLTRAAGEGRAFIKAEERPPVEPGRPLALVADVVERTPPPTPEELASREMHHLPEAGGLGHDDHGREHLPSKPKTRRPKTRRRKR